MASISFSVLLRIYNHNLISRKYFWLFLSLSHIWLLLFIHSNPIQFIALCSIIWICPAHTYTFIDYLFSYTNFTYPFQRFYREAEREEEKWIKNDESFFYIRSSPQLSRSYVLIFVTKSKNGGDGDAAWFQGWKLNRNSYTHVSTRKNFT